MELAKIYRSSIRDQNRARIKAGLMHLHGVRGTPVNLLPAVCLVKSICRRRLGKQSPANFLDRLRSRGLPKNSLAKAANIFSAGFLPHRENKYRQSFG